MVIMVACHASGQGSNPTRTIFFILIKFFLQFYNFIFSFIIEQYEPILCQHVGNDLKHPKKSIRF